MGKNNESLGCWFDSRPGRIYSTTIIPSGNDSAVSSLVSSSVSFDAFEVD